ncbi:Uncharacterised protein [Bordetella pertussis]|nr:Uncharacterised protein [Bordetella pertussis]
MLSSSAIRIRMRATSAEPPAGAGYAGHSGTGDGACPLRVYVEIYGTLDFYPVQSNAIIAKVRVFSRLFFSG